MLSLTLKLLAHRVAITKKTFFESSVLCATITDLRAFQIHSRILRLEQALTRLSSHPLKRQYVDGSHAGISPRL